jgi:2-keto-4-pentenoate hydratase/2-oxohepta-3-ene-1,7-dioic acid hydratase in catechol pathway
VKLVLYATPNSIPQPGLLTERGVVGVHDILEAVESPQEAMEYLIDTFEDLRPRLERALREAPPIVDEPILLLPPLPWPGKILCSTSSYSRRADAERAPQLMTLKSAESVIGPGGTIVLPDVGPGWQFVPELELGLVIRGPAKRVKAAADWRDVVFGYTCVVDVMARGDMQFGRDFWLAKSDTLGPLGPCIVTSDEIADPQALRVRSWQNGQLAQDYSTADGDYSIAEIVEFATTVMTLYTGDVIACGSSADGLRPLTDGDRLEVDIEGIGLLALSVRAMAGSRV